jgi:ATP-dependent RNA helicase DeaD
MKKLKFEELSLSEEIKNAVADMGFVEASPIQSEAIPYVLEGRDVIGQAQTGTGKTAAFGIPIIEMVDSENKEPQAIILCPTRELALQVSEEFKKISKYKKGIHTVAIYGGESIDRQIKAIRRGVQIIIGTPGRVIDHLTRGTLKLANIEMVVLDEADEMLDMGFREDIEAILEKVPEERQTIFFSATMSKPIMELTKRYQQNPHVIKISKNELTVSTIEQFYYDVKNNYKVEAMCRLIDMYNLKLMLVFCNTKKRVDEVVEELQIKGYSAEGLHGDMRQMQRNSVMTKFRAGLVNILVATDVAARGIDVENVEAVFNLDLPQDSEYYVHRIGRTGRAGKEGKSFTFVSGRESSQLREIQFQTKGKMTKGTIPTSKDVFKFKLDKFKDRINEVLTTELPEEFDSLIDEMVSEGVGLKDIAKGLLKMHLGVPASEKEELKFNASSEDRGRSRERDRDRGFDRDRGDRSERGERRERSRDSDGTSSKMVRLFINLGKNQKIRPGDIVGAIAGEAGLNGKQIGQIDIFDKHSFVEVPKDKVEQVLEVMVNNQIKGKRVNIEIAKN